MAGHGSNKSQKKKLNDETSTATADSVNVNQSTPPEETANPIDIDELARNKVNEIETTIETSKNCIDATTLVSCFSILKQIITAADLHRTNDKNEKSDNKATETQETGESIYADFNDDNEQFNTQLDLTERFATNSVKWTIRVRAFKLVHRLIRLFIDGQTSTSKSRNTVLKHLSDLIRLSFVAATSPYDELKMQGFEMFRYLIESFAHVEEKEFVGHSILEQYKTQVLSAVKPAFNNDAPPYITAIASQICSLWICQGLEKDPIDVKRTHQLMLQSIDKLESQAVNQNSKLYTESELEQERVDILGSWAQLYIASRELTVSRCTADDNTSELMQPSKFRMFKLTKDECDHLHALVEAQLENLMDKWWEALKDYALLIMPAPRIIGANIYDNQNVYTRDVALKLFKPTWPKLLYATTIWLCNNINCDKTKVSPTSRKQSSPEKYAKFIYGIIMKELCRRHIGTKLDQLPDTAILSLRSLHLLLIEEQTRSVIINDITMSREFYTILYQISTIYCRDINRVLIRTTLDLMFWFIVKSCRGNEKLVSFTSVKLVSQLMAAMRDAEIAIKRKLDSSDPDEAKSHLSIRLQNLVILLKTAPNIIFSEPQLRETILLVFHELIQFQLEPTVVISSLERLNELYPIIPSDHRHHFVTGMMQELLSQATSIFDDLYTKPTSEHDKALVSMWDAFYRSTRAAISETDRSLQQELIDIYVKSILMHIKVDEDLTSEKSKRKRDLLDANINQARALANMLKINLMDSLCSETRDRFLAIAKYQKDLKDKLEMAASSLKNASQARKSTGLNARPQATKITLKADFSNFYTKKQ